MSILVVGTVAFDTVETPFGRAERILGGSATYACLAARARAGGASAASAAALACVQASSLEAIPQP